MKTLDRSIPPQANDFEDYMPTPPEMRLSPNGIHSYYFQNEFLELLHFTILVKAGKNHEKTKCVAETCYKVLKEHRKGETSDEFSSIIDSFGATLSVNVYMESVYINMLVPKRNAVAFMKIVFELLLNPSFEENDINIYKQRKIRDLQYYLLKVDTRAFQLLYNNFFEKGTPTQTIISEELINAVTAEQIEGFYKESFCAENITFFAAGCLDKDIKNELGELLARIPRGKKIELVSLISAGNVEKKIFERRAESMQSAVVLCRKLSMSTPQFDHELDFVTTLLGNYFGSRLMQNLREKNGYTYGISCESVRFGKSILLYITSEVNAENCGKAIDECYKEMRRLQDETVGEEELQLVRNYMQGQLLRSVDGVTSFMKYFCSCHLKGYSEDEFMKKREIIRNITAARVKEIAGEVFCGADFSEIVVGNRN